MNYKYRNRKKRKKEKEARVRKYEEKMNAHLKKQLDDFELERLKNEN